ncbi:MAG: hypothetical protein LBI48_09600 [Burkholderiaceae bacterium]|jgi:hypothetical protein|nr:hypothetical protein [Burkholderiaceae bacterium]
MNGELWIVDANGKRYDLTGPNAAMNQPSLPVMARACAQIVRFTGHARRPYSVAEHQLLCAEIAKARDLPPLVQLACLTHDLHEAWLGDVSTPVKLALGDVWASLESPHALHLRQYLGLTAVFSAHRAVIKQIDLIALATERRDLLLWGLDNHDPWPALDAPGASIAPYADADLNEDWREKQSWRDWMESYIVHYHILQEQTQLFTPAKD